MPFEAVSFGDWRQQPNWCHANVVHWVDANPGWKVVHGWLFDPIKQAFLAHSVAETPTGMLVDITPAPAHMLYPFIRHQGDPANYAEAIRTEAIVQLDCLR